MKPERAENENEEKNNNRDSNKIERHSCFWVPGLCWFLHCALYTVAGIDTRTQNRRKNQFNEQNMQ